MVIRTNILTPQTLFQLPQKYIIPEFQRRYVWTHADQWGPLWDDVQNLAENYLDALEQNSGVELLAMENTKPHFLGAVVVQNRPVAPGQITQSEIIDGQQRMTTIQLLLDAVQEVCQNIGQDDVAQRLSILVSNEHFMPVGGHGDVLKLEPTPTDRNAFRHAMHNGLATDDFEDSLIVQAHEFFQRMTIDWLGTDEDVLEIRATALAAAVTVLLQVVVINIDVDDDASVIFEILNARGTPLEQADLIKNYVVSNSGLPSGEAIGVWGDLDDDWWLEEVRQGRLLRPRRDMLLNYWTAARTTRDVPANRVFHRFKDQVERRSVSEVMPEALSDLGNYRRFESGERTLEEDIFHYHINVMGASAITPIVLHFLSESSEIRSRGFRALESFLIRRTLLRIAAQGYNRLFMEIARSLNRVEYERPDMVLIQTLSQQTAYSQQWPSDVQLISQMSDAPLYRLLTRGRLRIVLEGIERELMSSAMSEHSIVSRNLTIEHVMPRSWQTRWPLSDRTTDVETATDQRNRLVHTIGNLTLVAQPLNSALSNAPWEEKRETLGDHSVLFLNKELQDEPVWNEKKIMARSQRMAELITKIWPGPGSSIWGR